MYVCRVCDVRTYVCLYTCLQCMCGTVWGRNGRTKPVNFFFRQVKSTIYLLKFRPKVSSSGFMWCNRF